MIQIFQHPINRTCNSVPANSQLFVLGREEYFQSLKIHSMSCRIVNCLLMLCYSTFQVCFKKAFFARLKLQLDCFYNFSSPLSPFLNDTYNEANTSVTKWGRNFVSHLRKKKTLKTLNTHIVLIKMRNFGGTVYALSHEKRNSILFTSLPLKWSLSQSWVFVMKCSNFSNSVVFLFVKVTWLQG